ncbi:hypothetical protein DXG01_001218 [Tephrocybe rancida]|nr:hypothetical protein DXG01_001218 [Tephrocybe rancida]
MSQNNSALVGSVFERKPTSYSAPKAFIPAKTGFPAVQHRSKSAFARNIQGIRKTGSLRPQNAPTIAASKPARPLDPVDPDDWRNQMSRENNERVASMTEEEREQERQEILDRFGAGVGDLLKRVKLAREKQVKSATQNDTIDASEDRTLLEPVTAKEPLDREIASNRFSPPPPALSTNTTRPSSRADRKLRFAELGPEDVHVYESAPPSPRRKALALPPPSNDGSAVSLGTYSGTLTAPSSSSTEPIANADPEEGSAEYIRRRYFPEAPANDPNLAWMQSSKTEDPQPSSSLRFDLSGKPIPASVSSTLPTHLGLHHHAEGSHAGYTLDDMFLLSRSTVPAQRATMLGVLAKVAQRIAAMAQGETTGLEELAGKEEELRKRIVAAGAEALAERGSVGARAIEVVWQCIVGWDVVTTSIEGVELESPSDATINSLRLDFLLPQTASLFAQGDLLQESRSQLLAVLHRLAQHSNTFATSIVTTPKLVASIIQNFLLTPIPPTEASSPPDPLALQLLITLANASRQNATALVEFADALLRFITFLPSSSMYPSALATSLLTATLRFYTVLANFGLYSHIATTAVEQLSQLSRYILSDACCSQNLMVAWLDLLSAWMTCAIDPHQTTPGHEILWSQVIGWGWNSEVDSLSDRLGIEDKDWPVWAGVWRIHSVWLEGARVNGIRGGSSERMECLNMIRAGFEDGKEKEVVIGCLEAIKSSMGQLTVPIGQAQLPHLRTSAGHAATLGAAIRLWLSCLPPLSDTSLESPPFPLPFTQISSLCAAITTHSLWLVLGSTEKSTQAAPVYLRSLSELLSVYLRLSRRLPSTSKELWAVQALSVISKLLPGDEAFGSQILDGVFTLITPEWLETLGIKAPPAIWRRGGISVITPFVAHMVRPHPDISIAPTSSTPQSILATTTQRLPSATALRTFGLPVSREWTLSPLDHLLRSGSSEVFKALPVDWDASEVDIVRASLLLTRVCREVLSRFTLTEFILTRSEAVFGCMKVFMLEHGQTQGADSSEEVFRDQVVGQFMTDILRPYAVSVTSTTTVKSPSSSGDLEQAACKFLGATPFYQYYTDFVALYDSISFSYPLFASLLLPPTSMRYALDYRKHLWNDFGHILKTIRTPVEQVICEDVKEYLWPVEEDSQMLSFYLRGLLKQQLQGFVRLVALHHVASSVWSDIHAGPGWGEERASKLMTTVAEQGSHELVREVVQYQQSATGAAILPPQCFDISDDQIRAKRLECIDELTLLATSYAFSTGLLYLPPAERQPTVPESAIHAPLSLFPSPLPRSLFESAKRIQGIYNTLYARIALDEEFLDRIMGTKNGVGKVDDFIGQLWTGWKELRDKKMAQSLHLGLFRSDYLLHAPPDAPPSLKQVEFNTISVSFGSLSERTARLHRYLYASTQYYNTSSHIKQQNFPENDTIAGLTEGLAAAHKAYNKEQTFVLFVVQPGERNVFDQRPLEYQLLEKHSIRAIRRTFEELAESATLDPATRILRVNVPPSIHPGGLAEISVVYFRAGYAPHEYQTPKHYQTRFLLEQSIAINCPSIALQLAGGKKVQEVLTQPGVLEHFLADQQKWGAAVFSPSELDELRQTFMGMWGLDAGSDLLTPDLAALESGKESFGMQKARELALSLVLKPQREGGGNNVYKDSIPPFLDNLPPKERQAWIAMELIVPPKGAGNYLIRAGSGNQAAANVEVVSELGIFGWALFGEYVDIRQQQGGWLVRTKGRDSDEGGVATGFSVLDSILLVDG